VGDKLDKQIAELAVLAHASVTREAFRAEALSRMARLLGFDAGIIYDPPTSPGAQGSVHGFDPWYWHHFAAEAQRLAPDSEPLLRAATSCAGVSLDTDVLDVATRSKLGFYSEIVYPVGVWQFLTLVLPRRGSSPAIAQLGRTGGFGSYRSAQIQAAERMVPILSLAESVFLQPPLAHTPAVHQALDGLSPREREVATLIARGLQNKEIAALLGTTVNTVRKQSIRVFAKTGSHGRLALALLMRRSGL
jgi:DNA-binding CsgD family transcriptional regulator